MRNLNNFNHWLAEVRDIARRAKVRNEEDENPMSEAQLRLAFNKTTMDCYYSTMASPQEAFDEEMDRWLPAVRLVRAIGAEGEAQGGSGAALCQSCMGNGYIQLMQSRCPECKGSGEVPYEGVLP